MKKFIYSLVLFSILGLLSGFSYGMNCSLYDDLINTIQAQMNLLKQKVQRESNGHFTPDQVEQVLLTSKYADEYRSLMTEYNSAIQQKDNCLGNESSNYNTNSNYTYNANNSNNNVLELFTTTMQAGLDAKDAKNYNQAIEYFVQSNEICERYPNDTNISDVCKKMPHLTASLCYIAGNETRLSGNYEKAIEYFNKGLEYDSSDDGLYLGLGTTAYQQNKYNVAISYFTLAKKYARNNEDKQKYEGYIKECEKKLGDISNSEETEKCFEGYILNETETECVKDTIQQRKLNCSTRYGNKSILADNGEDCDCSDGYIRNEDNTKCVKDTKEQREKNCKSRSPISFLGYDGETCECPDGYVADSDNPNYCLIDLSQKSLQSRIMNTNDAKCDTTQIISNCSKDPTGDSCPAVCLELYDAINWMYENKLTIYNDPTKFGIYNPITREQASKFFVNFYIAAFDKVLSIPIQNPFKDIENADPTLYRYILSSYSFGLFKGTNGKFMPFNHLTKAQALAVMIRMALGILDESQQPRYSNYLYKAESMKLLDNINYSYTTLDNEDIVRGDVALILYRLFDYLEQ